MAFSTVAKWTGSAIISNLVDTAYSYLAERMLPPNTESELRTLNAALPKIAAVMGVGEALKLKHPNSQVNEWLNQFKEAFLAAEDVLDELKYQELEDMVKMRDEVSGSSSSIIGSLKRKFTGSKISEDTLKKLRGAVKILDLASADVGKFFQFAIALDVYGLAKSNNEPVCTSSRETTSFLTETKVFGRETEKTIIIEWLKKSASHVHISAFCIVGMGGLGKTTLAQLISEEISRENQFDEIIWVCVSTSFSVKDITRKILHELGGEGHNDESLNRLQIKLKGKVLSKKLLFILDDVWNDEKMCDWEKLIAPLKFVQQGSKILLTTRMKSVVDMLSHVLNVEQENLVLEGLEEKELLELFNKYSFHGYNPGNHKDLQKIGNDIVKKLRGSPLAAKVIGSLLNSHMDFHYWKIISNHDSLINLEQAKDVADVLKLSYYHLPTDLQECFRFCCIFPEDYEFKKNELIKMWMASGFIRQELQGDERQEDIGEEYFNHLFRRSFFEQRCKYQTYYYYVMHDLIHDLAQNASKGECCRVEPNGISDNLPSTAQHVSIHESEIQRISNLTNLRTLVITIPEIPINRDRFVLPSSALKETLRILVIDGIGKCELSEDIGHLIHLRFLKVNTPYVVQSFRYLLPNSIYKLYHLQVLDMYGINPYSDYERVETTGMTNLISLRYMNLPDQVMQNICRIHKLTSLQKLNFFVGRGSGHRIDELEKLNNLRRLSIQKIENVGDPLEVTNANLSKKKNLISLSLHWTPWSRDANPEQVIDNFRPHPNLMKLTIMSYTGHRSPIWMRDSSHLDLSMLSYLKLVSCPLWEAIPFLGQIPHLKELYLHEMDEVKEMDYSCNNTCDCAFPSLERLYCSNMPKWESWVGPHNRCSHPNLKELTITNCPNLAKIPAIPFSLFKFDVQNVGLNSLPDMHHGSSITTQAPAYMKSSLRVVEIISCPKLVSLNGFLQQRSLDLQDIEQLTIIDCKNLLQLPIERFGKLTSLKYLTIKNNPELTKADFQSNLLPIKLQNLSLGNCGQLEVPLLEASFGLTNLTHLQLSRNAHITSITSSENIFASLEYMAIKKCHKLVEFSSVDNQGNNLAFLKMNKLDIEDCPNLTKFPNMPFFLNSFTIINVAVSDLPEYFQSSRSSGLTSSSLKPSLKIVKIYRCSNLTSLNGFLFQENIDLQGLQELTIVNCENLVQLPTGAFAKFVSLKHLTIEGSPKLVTVDKQSNLLPVELESLQMRNCGELDVPLLESASFLCKLATLCIGNSANITRIPSSENAFASLSTLKISGCYKLIELSSMQQAHLINPKNNFVSSKISSLDIDYLCLLLVEPFRCLRFVRYLEVGNCSGMEALPEQWLLQNCNTLKDLFIRDASSLQSLPSTMVMLTALKELKINNATLLEVIPELPTSLTFKSINRTGFQFINLEK